MALNQYELVLASAEYIRRNPDDPIVRKLKSVKTQLEVEEIFTKEVLEKQEKHEND